VFDEHYEEGWLVSEHAREILRRREAGWKRRGARSPCYADPSIVASHGRSTPWGQPASVLTEYREHGVDWVVAANHDRLQRQATKDGAAQAFTLLDEWGLTDPALQQEAWDECKGLFDSSQAIVVGEVRRTLAEAGVSEQELLSLPHAQQEQLVQPIN
jgi:hypothetical protein